MTGPAGDVTQQGADQEAGGPGGLGADGAGRGAPAAGSGRTPWRAVFFALAAVAIVAGVAWALLESRFFVVRSVQVTGTHLVTGAEVRSAAAIPPGLPLIRVNGATVAHRVEQIRQVQSARVSRNWPDGITIAVTERTAEIAGWQNGVARQQRRRDSDAAARELPVRLAVPLVLCTLPSFVLLAIVPLLLGALSSLHT